MRTVIALCKEISMAATGKTATSKKSEKADTKTPAPRKRTVASAAATAPRQRSASKVQEAQPITAEERLRHIEVAAYYIAEKRGFSGGDAAEDWMAAESQVDGLLLAGRLPG